MEIMGISGSWEEEYRCWAGEGWVGGWVRGGRAGVWVGGKARARYCCVETTIVVF